MATTIATLLRQPGLGGVRVRCCADRLDLPIRWVATSELPDPTPYLEGGELLLTTGMRLPRTQAESDAYVGRLASVGVVGIGFGVGFAHDRVPRVLLNSARRLDVPVLEVDRPTPFIAISKAVSDLLAKAEYSELLETVKAQQNLTKAATLRGPAGVVEALAQLAGGWALQADAHGVVLHESPDGVSERHTSWRAELGRMRGSGPIAVATVDREQHLAIRALGPSGRVRGFLVTGRPAAPSGRDRALVNVAAAFMSFWLEEEGAEDQARRSRSAVLRLAIERPESVHGLLPDLGGPVFASETVHALVALGPPHALERLHGRLEDEGSAHMYPGRLDDSLLVLVPSRTELARLLRSSPPGIHLGSSLPAGLGSLATAVIQARRAALSARAAGLAARRFDELSGSGLESLLGPGGAEAFASTMLEPLKRYEAESGVELLASVRVWLAHHGQYEAAAVELGIHRHTLRYRVRKAATLLDRDLDDATTRMELWFALTVAAP